MMEQVALLVAVAAGQSLYGDGRRSRSSEGESIGTRDSKCEKVSCPSEKIKPWPVFLRVTDSTAKDFARRTDQVKAFWEIFFYETYVEAFFSSGTEG